MTATYGREAATEIIQSATISYTGPDDPEDKTKPPPAPPKPEPAVGSYEKLMAAFGGGPRAR